MLNFKQASQSYYTLGKARCLASFRRNKDCIEHYASIEAKPTKLLYCIVDLTTNRKQEADEKAQEGEKAEYKKGETFQK